MHTKPRAMFINCELCNRRDRVCDTIAAAIRNGVVKINHYICGTCGESEAGKQAMASWPPEEPFEQILADGAPTES
jgi:hypothetical protein